MVDTLATVQELTHHLPIQEMDFEFFNITGVGGDNEFIATGLVTYSFSREIVRIESPGYKLTTLNFNTPEAHEVTLRILRRH